MVLRQISDKKNARSKATGEPSKFLIDLVNTTVFLGSINLQEGST